MPADVDANAGPRNLELGGWNEAARHATAVSGLMWGEGGVIACEWAAGWWDGFWMDGRVVVRVAAC